MRPKLSPEPGSQPTRPRTCQAAPKDCRGESVDAEAGQRGHPETTARIGDGKTQQSRAAQVFGARKAGGVIMLSQ